MAFGSFFIYLIAVNRGLGKEKALLLALSYLIFFPLAGANFFDIHSISFFPTLFMAAYYFYLRAKTLPAFVFFILASIVKYPLSLLIALFSIILIFDLWHGDKLEKIQKKKRQYIIAIVTFIFATFLFLVRYLYLLIFIHIGIAGDAHITGFFGPSVSNYDIVITFLILIGPFLFLPLLSIKSLPFCIGFFVLIEITRFWGYAYPDGITDQYLYLLVPYLYIGTIEVLSGRTYAKIFIKKINILLHRYNNNSNYRKIKKVIGANKAVYYIVLIIVLMAMFFEPYGPMNNINNDFSFHMNNTLNVNCSQYKNIEYLVGTVPQHNPYVVIQNGIPEFFPRSFNTSGNPMDTPGILEVPGVGAGLLYNLSYQNSNGVWEKLKIDYVVADPYQSTYYEALSSPYNLSMYDLVKELYSSGEYGIYSEIDGMVVLKHNYKSLPEYYKPFEYNMDSKTFYSSYIRDGNVNIGNVNTRHSQWIIVFRTPTIAMSPGKYEINITYSYSEKQGNNSSFQIVSSTSGNIINNSTTYCLNQNNMKSPGTIHTFHAFEYFRNFTDDFTIWGQIPPLSTLNGTLSIYNISINQIQKS